MIPKKYIIKQINLDKIFKQEKHADKAILLRNNILVLIEETGRPETRDLEKIEATITREALEQIKNALNANPRDIYAFIHFRRDDTFF